MSPAVTSIPPTPEGEARPTCISCVGELSDAALKCCHCQAHVHLRCSLLPDYQLIRLASTQSSYSCPKCVKSKDLKGDEENYTDEETRIKEIIAKEVSIVDNNNSNLDTTAVEMPNDPTPLTGTVGSPRAAQTGTAQRAICKFYLQKSCKHGRKGDDCNYSHPKLCYSYIKRGDKRGGCKKGSQCSYVHPKLSPCS